MIQHVIVGMALISFASGAALALGIVFMYFAGGRR